MFSLLLAARDEDGNALSDEELRDELMTLLVAGHETTATALAWTLERLARHPEALAGVVAEQRAGGEELIDATIKETLRLRPVVPAVARQLQAPMTFGGWDLPAGVNIAPSIYLLHRRPDLYPIRWRSGLSASSSARTGPMSGSRSAAACAAAWARASHCSKCESCSQRCWNG